MLEKHKKNYNVVIIGAGISGLTSAALLSKAGLNVCVIELNAKPGGYLAKYEKKGFVFDTAIHWLNHCGPDGIVNKVFSLIGPDFPRAKPQKRIKRFIGKEFNYLLTDNPDELKKQLIEGFQSEKKGIEDFFNAAKKMSPQFNNFHKLFRTAETLTFSEKVKLVYTKIKFAIPFIKYIRFTGEKGKKKGLNKFFKSRVLHEVFSNEPDILSCLIPIAWAYNKDFQSPPKSGSQSYALWTANEAEKYGCDIFYNSKAKKITQENGKCKSVIYEHKNQEYQVFCEQIISTCDIRSLYEEIMPGQYTPKKTLKKLKEADLYSSALIVNASLDCPAENLGFGEEIIALNKYELDKKENSEQEINIEQLSIFSQSARNKTLAPEGRGTLTFIMPAYFTNHNNWKTTTDSNNNLIRGKDYSALKTLYAEKIIKIAEEELSKNILSHITEYNVITPITFWRYTKNYHGSMMGQKPGKKNSMLGVAKYKTPLKGLYISGHWAELGGGVPIAIKTAYNSTLMILKERKHKFFKLFVDELKKKNNIKPKT